MLGADVQTFRRGCRKRAPFPSWIRWYIPASTSRCARLTGGFRQVAALRVICGCATVHHGWRAGVRSMLSRIMAHAEPALASETAEDASIAYFAAMESLRRFLSADPPLSKAGGDADVRQPLGGRRLHHPAGTGGLARQPCVRLCVLRVQPAAGRDPRKPHALPILRLCLRATAHSSASIGKRSARLGSMMRCVPPPMAPMAS